MQLKLGHIDKIQIGSTEAFLEEIQEHFCKNKRKRIIVLNAELFLQTLYKRDLAEAIHEADYILPSGKTILWALAYLHPQLRAAPKPLRPIQDHTQIIFPILEASQQHKTSIFFLGGKRIKQAKKLIKQAFPNLKILGFHSRALFKENESGIISKLKKLHAQITILDLRAGAQELWLSQKISELPDSLYIAQENSIERFAGRSSRGLPKLFRIKTWHSFTYKSLFIAYILIYTLFSRKAKAPKIQLKTKMRITSHKTR